jgi:hypothetical protein
MKTSAWLLLAPAVISLGCSPELTELGGSATATVDQRQAAVASRAPGFGGMFIDGDGHLAVHVRRHFDRARTIDAIAEVFPERAMAPMRLIEGGFGFAELARWHDSALEVLELPDVVFTDLDEKRNRVVIAVEHAAAMAEVQAELDALGIPREAAIVELAEPIVNMATLRDRIRPLVGGLQIRFSGFLCTLGFNASFGGETGFVVNSHCTDNESKVDHTLYYQPLNQVAAEFIGTEILDPPFFTSRDNLACPKGAKCRFSDAAYAQLDPNASAALGSLARTTGPANSRSLEIAGNYTITSEATDNALVGEQVNKVGRTTGWTQGLVTNRCVNTGVSGTRIVRLCQDFVAAGVGAGDSGSPVFRIDGGSSVQLKGILWGGTAAGTLFVYSPLHLVEQELGGLTTH